MPSGSGAKIDYGHPKYEEVMRKLNLKIEYLKDEINKVKLQSWKYEYYM